jgi:hypothetical protein
MVTPCARPALRLLPMHHDTVTPRALGAVQRLVGGFEHRFGVAMIGLALGHADADGDRDRAAAARPALAPGVSSCGRLCWSRSCIT